jgi:predicted transcriptional regulator
MQHLNPTLWRTCRMLAGASRIHLLRCLDESPGRNVSELAEAVGLGLPAASQELRRIQSRGFLQAERHKASLVYRFGADPQVLSADPLLKAVRASLARRGPQADARIQAIARAFAHPKRLTLLNSLRTAPRSAFALHQEFHWAYRTLQRHLIILLESGLIRRQDRRLHFVPPVHPLAKALVKLLPAG